MDGVVAVAANDDVLAADTVGGRVAAYEQVVAAAADDVLDVAADGVAFAQLAIVAVDVIQRDGDVGGVIGIIHNVAFELVWRGIGHRNIGAADHEVSALTTLESIVARFTE